MVKKSIFSARYEKNITCVRFFVCDLGGKDNKIKMSKIPTYPSLNQLKIHSIKNASKRGSHVDQMELIHGSVSRGRVEGGEQLGDGLPPPAHRQVHQQLKHCNTVSVVLGRSHLKLCDVDQCQV